MKRKTVKSSNIKSIGYDIETKVLELEFNNNAVYCYLNVDLRTIVKFIFTESLGKYFIANIKNKFKCVKGELK